MRGIVGGLLLVVAITQSAQAGWADRMVAKAAWKSAVHIVTQYPIIISAVIMFAFRYEIMDFLRNSLLPVVGEYPIASLVVGLAVLKIISDRLNTA